MGAERYLGCSVLLHITQPLADRLCLLARRNARRELAAQVLNLVTLVVVAALERVALVRQLHDVLPRLTQLRALLGALQVILELQLLQLDQQRRTVLQRTADLCAC